MHEVQALGPVRLSISYLGLGHLKFQAFSCVRLSGYLLGSAPLRAF